MFTRSSKTVSKKAETPIVVRRDSSGAPSIISDGVQIMGDIDSPGELQLDGSVQGNIKCSALILGESAVVEGQIIADSITIRGRVEGDMRGNTVRLEKAAIVAGNIYHRTISIEAGARIRGNLVHMEDGDLAHDHEHDQKCAIKSKTASADTGETPTPVRSLEPTA